MSKDNDYNLFFHVYILKPQYKNKNIKHAKNKKRVNLVCSTYLVCKLNNVFNVTIKELLSSVHLLIFNVL